MQGEHGRLTSTTNKHQRQSCRDNQGTSCDGPTIISGDERCCALAHDHLRTMSGEVETERVGKVTKHQDTNQEEHIGKARHDKCLL